MLKRIFIIIATAGALAAPASCESPLFHCEGEDPSQPGQPLCYCEANGLLCGHDGFDGCLWCPVPEVD